MTVYIRTPYGSFPHHHRMHRCGPYPFAGEDIFFPMDVIAEQDAFVITALLPGLKAEDVSIQISKENITLEGEFKHEVDDKANYIMQEIPSGKFSRSITLPDLLDATNAGAEMKDGVLILRVPKAEETKPKTIKVTAT